MRTGGAVFWPAVAAGSPRYYGARRSCVPFHIGRERRGVIRRLVLCFRKTRRLSKVGVEAMRSHRFASPNGCYVSSRHTAARSEARTVGFAYFLLKL